MPAFVIPFSSISDRLIDSLRPSQLRRSLSYIEDKKDTENKNRSSSLTPITNLLYQFSHALQFHSIPGVLLITHWFLEPSQGDVRFNSRGAP